jgi:hypothetical protein
VAIVPPPFAGSWLMLMLFWAALSRRGLRLMLGRTSLGPQPRADVVPRYSWRTPRQRLGRDTYQLVSQLDCRVTAPPGSLVAH